MRYHQLKEIYQHVTQINQELNDLYRHFLDQTKDERTRIFLYYIIEKQTENILDIKNLIRDESIGVLSTWLDENIEHDISALIITFKEKTDVNIETMLDMTTQVREQLNDWLFTIKELVTGETVKTHLENLIQHQSLKSQQLMHAAHRMDDI
ncbi:hypothetical protein EKO29_13275 [Colwellia sp. Arc7-635]|uniref:hypothetical protein n=1 Tax=Colwellia sp. Arc7-635 TaxID=2497879 RepID=UPI000F857452|nr:hypothetical protein [Colwellia sp. Arc7-635]AZQ84877.1 hypothetical protein EKO29_13275 [Colwellia sp. Arc7-635]